MEPEYDEGWLEHVFYVLDNLETRVREVEIAMRDRSLPAELPDNVIIFPGRDRE